MLQKNYTTINLRLRSPAGNPVAGAVIVRDEFALVTFSDPKLARQLYEMELKQGEDVAFNDKQNALIKRYKGKKKDEIITILKKEITNAGGTLTR